MAYFAELDGSKVDDRIFMLTVAYGSEIIAAQQYWAHGVAAKGIASTQLQDVFYTHADDEMGHAAKLRDRIHTLGGQLKNDLKFMLESQAVINSGDVQPSMDVLRMLQLDAEAELNAIRVYEEIAAKVRDFDPVTWKLVVEIAGDEYDHANEACNLLGK